MTSTAPGHQVQLSAEEQWDAAILQIIESLKQAPNVDTIPQAIATLIATGGQYQEQSVHAMYLQKTDQFTREQITVYLASDDAADQLLETYFQLVSFQSKSVEDSIRAYFIELKLCILSNSTQMNTLLFALASAYMAVNATVFDSSAQAAQAQAAPEMSMHDKIDDCQNIYNACLMLQASLHGRQAIGRSRITEQGFMGIIFDHQSHDIPNFGPSKMRRLYHSIANWSMKVQQCPHNHRTVVQIAVAKSEREIEEANANENGAAAADEPGTTDERKPSAGESANQRDHEAGCACVIL